MSRSISTPPQILCYGKYLNLLESRRMLLEAIGYDVDISDRSTDLRRCLDIDPEYALIIVCHTISAKERLSIESQCRVQEGNTVVYSLEGSIDPEELTLRIDELLDRVGSRRIDRSFNAPIGVTLLPMMAVCHF